MTVFPAFFEIVIRAEGLGEDMPQAFQGLKQLFLFYIYLLQKHSFKKLVIKEGLLTVGLVQLS